MKKTKSIPAIVTLLGAAVSVIVTFINGYELEKMLKILLLVIVIFLILGLIIKYLFEKYIPPIEEEEEVLDDEGSVIEKFSEEGMTEEGIVQGDEGIQTPVQSENV